MQNYSFDGFLFHGGKRLSKDGVLIKMPPKEQAVLKVLVEKNNEEVSKDYLLSSVWLNNRVSDESLSRCVYNLRKILNRHGGSGAISTIYGHGYSLCARVDVVDERQGKAILSPEGKSHLSPMTFIDDDVKQWMPEYLIQRIECQEKNALQEALSMLLAKENDFGWYSSYYLILADVYLTLALLNDDKSDNSLLDNARFCAEKVLLTAPLNPGALAILGVMNTINEEKMAGYHYISQASLLASGHPRVRYYLVLHYFYEKNYSSALGELKLLIN